MFLSHPRRQQFRRLAHAVSRAAASALTGCAALAAAVEGRLAVATGLLLLASAFALASRHAFGLAARNRVGADSEALVRRALAVLAHEGWRVKHSVDWVRAGDLDHVLRSPTGRGFVIETKTTRYVRAHLERTVAAARWLSRRRRRYPRGVVPVVCIARACWVERVEHGVLIVSLDGLVAALSAAAVASPASIR